MNKEFFIQNRISYNETKRRDEAKLASKIKTKNRNTVS